VARRRSLGATRTGRVNLPPPGAPCGALQALMNDGGQVTLGAIGEIPAAAVAITPKGMLVGLTLNWQVELDVFVGAVAGRGKRNGRRTRIKERLKAH
jgi:hypothetical protein